MVWESLRGEEDAMFGLFSQKNRPINYSRSLRQKLRLNSLESRDVPSIVPHIAGGDLMIEGTKGDDLIRVRLDANEFVGIVVEANGSVSEKIALEDVNRIEIHGGEGNDRIFISSNIRIPSLLDGGAGNDWLFASDGSSRQFSPSQSREMSVASRPGRPPANAILIGAEGNDVLFGTDDRDMLIGGDGADVIHGNGAEDIVMAGRTLVDGNTKALFSLMASWNSTDAYADRVANVRLEMESLIPPDLDAPFMYHDGSADVLIGGAGRDWFFAGSSKPIDWTLGEEVE
jgi:Ca2+-binding RTX toxin-like protein